MAPDPRRLDAEALALFARKGREGGPQVPQAGEATYAAKIGPEDRELDLSQPADVLVNRVRALSPHIGARGELHGRRVTVWRARVGEDGAFEPLEVQPEGGRRMAYDAWLRGLR